MKNQVIGVDMVQSNHRSATHERDISLDNVSEKAAVWRNLVWIIFVSMVVKTFLAWSFPFTGDEAYLALWGKYVASGYYDHPPILGWLLHLLQYLGRSPVVLRLMPIII